MSRRLASLGAVVLVSSLAVGIAYSQLEPLFRANA